MNPDLITGKYVGKVITTDGWTDLRTTHKTPGLETVRRGTGYRK